MLVATASRATRVTYSAKVLEVTSTHTSKWLGPEKYGMASLRPMSAGLSPIKGRSSAEPRGRASSLKRSLRYAVSPAMKARSSLASGRSPSMSSALLGWK